MKDVRTASHLYLLIRLRPLSLSRVLALICYSVLTLSTRRVPTMAGTFSSLFQWRSLTVLCSDQFELASPPFDSVSSVRFSPTNPSHLLVSSWDTVSHASVLVGSARGGGGGEGRVKRMVWEEAFCPCLLLLYLAVWTKLTLF